MTQRAAVLSLLFMFLAMTLAAADAGSTALLVLESDEAKLDAALRPAISDVAPLVRATAARVANVRNRTPLLDALRTQLDGETDFTAAREEARAVVMLGGAGEIDRALAASDRFRKQLDAPVAIAVARLGPDVAIPAYFDKLRTRAAIGEFFPQVLWGHSELRNALASRLISAGDVRGFSAVLAGDVDSGVLVAALRASSDLRAAATQHILQAGVPTDERLRAAIAELPPVAGIDDELLHRAAGVAPRSMADLLQSEAARNRVRWFPGGPKLLTPEEQQIFSGDKPPVVIKTGTTGQAVAKRKFRLPSTMPEGLGAALLRQTRCRGTWIGVVNTTVDSAGRVTDADMSQLTAGSECLTAATALLRLSLAESPEAGAPRSEPVQMVHAAKPDVCLDEEVKTGDIAPPRVGSAVGSDVKPPKVLHRVNPVYPNTALAAGVQGFVIIEIRISRRGCVSDEQIVRQTTSGGLNASALLALDAWTFEPGTLNGQPVDVISDQFFHFKN